MKFFLILLICVSAVLSDSNRDDNANICASCDSLLYLNKILGKNIFVSKAIAVSFGGARTTCIKNSEKCIIVPSNLNEKTLSIVCSSIKITELLNDSRKAILFIKELFPLFNSINRFDILDIKKLDSCWLSTIVIETVFWNNYKPEKKLSLIRFQFDDRGHFYDVSINDIFENVPSRTFFRYPPQ